MGLNLGRDIRVFFFFFFWSVANAGLIKHFNLPYDGNEKQLQQH